MLHAPATKRRRRAWHLLLAGMMLLAAGATAPISVVANDEAAHEAGSHAVEGPITKKPQDTDLAIWSLVTFAVFLYVLKILAWKPITEGLDKREARIIGAISDAEAARSRAEKMLAEHQQKLDKVQEEIRDLMAEARRDAEHTKTEILAAAQREAEATRQRAVQEIERARDQALDDLFDHMARCVEEATERVVGRSLTGPDHERLITEALGGIVRRQN
jgi:F-type H+-transporting ATPase subunit b